MKIAFLNIYSGRVSRGAETAVAEVAKRLSKHNQVTVFQSAETNESTYTIYRVHGVPFIQNDVSTSLVLRLLKKFYCDPYSLVVLYFSLRALPTLLKTTYDIIIPINGFWQILVCKLVKLLRGSKVVVLGYSGIGIDDYVNVKLHPDAFFAMSTVAARWAKTVNSTVPTSVLHGGVDTKVFHPNVQPMKLSLKHPIVLTVAALVPYKRVDLVIKAVAKLPHVSLVVAGKGPLNAEIEALGKKLLDDRFLRIDASYDELPGLYTACDVFTLPSLHEDSSLFKKITGTQALEAFGIVYVEAMSSGLPIVAPNDALRQEIVGDAGILVDCTSINTYTKAIQAALERKWGDIPRKQAAKFDWEKIAQRFSEELLSLHQKR